MQRTLQSETRKEEYGHPKELMEKLNTSCLSVKLTLETVPKIVERIEQKKKLHEMCAQVVLDVNNLQTQQALLINRFRENKELLTEVEAGMKENLEIAKKNIEILKQKPN